MSGPSRTKFGNVVSSNLSFGAPKNASHDIMHNFKLLRGQISAIYTVDLSDNSPSGSTKGLVTRCDVTVYRRDGSSEIIPQCMMMQPGFGGGINDFMEVVGPNPGPTANDPTISERDKPGQMVILGLVEGMKQGGVILGALPHTNPVAVANRPTAAEGSRLQGEVRGLNWLIDSDGALTVTFNGLRLNDGSLATTAGPSAVNIDKTGKITVSTNNEQTVFIDPVAQVVSVTNGPTTFVMDGKANKITQSAKTVEQLGSDTSRLQGGQVLISKTPNSTPTEPLVLGNVFTTMMNKLLTAIENHNHIGNLGSPTSPPINAADFAQLASSPIGDNAILSDFASTEKG
jgi:hypothetical protein